MLNRTVTPAIKTLQAIDAAIDADGGAKFRFFEGQVLPHITDAYRQDDEVHRSHLGASIIGNECARAPWMSFRWMTKPKFPARILRLFNRGHLEEGRFIALLLMIGVQVFQQDAEGKQFRISHAQGHMGGSGDGVGIGIPDLEPDTAALVEAKTHGEKSFIELAGPLNDWRKYVEGKGPFLGKGVRDAKHEHYVQMQTYMRKMGLAVALYIAVNKNTDDIYMEIVFLDTETADLFLDRGDKLIWMKEPPKRLNESPGFFKCRFCDHRPACHLKAKLDFNCRSCQFAETRDNAEWFCTKHNKILDKAAQYAACEDHVDIIL